MQLTKDLFQHKDYKQYINEKLDNGLVTRGARSLFAKAINCQTAYVSSVLRGQLHFTPEQGEAINNFFHHSDMESDYFLLLLQWQRAGTAHLKQRLKKNMEKILEARFTIHKRLELTAVLSEEHQTIYYSEWYYAAIHALTSIPEFQTIDAIAQRLNLEKSMTAKVLSFLTETGLVKHTKNLYSIGTTRIHLGSDSPIVSRHHTNWRLLTAQLLHKRQSTDLHYSSVITISHEDVEKLKELILQFITSSKQIIRTSKEEDLYSLNLDFFQL